MTTDTLRYAMAAIVLLLLTGCGDLTADTQSLLVPYFKRSEVLGFVAGLGTTFAAVPDLIAMLRRKSTQGLNPRMSAIMGVFQLLWIWYGLVIASRPVILWNVIGALTNAFCVGAYAHFSGVEKKRQAAPVPEKPPAPPAPPA